VTADVIAWTWLASLLPVWSITAWRMHSGILRDPRFRGVSRREQLTAALVLGSVQAAVWPVSVIRIVLYWLARRLIRRPC
jgi:hypothetical protein